MKVRVLYLVLIASLATTCAQQTRTEWTAFENVSVIPMDGERVLSEQTVIVRGDRIVALGPSSILPVPEGARRIPASGQFLIPGMAEMHGHIPTGNASREFVDSVLFLYLSNGITTVRGMLGGPGQLEMRQGASKREIWSPTLYLAGPSFSGNSIDTPQEAVDRVMQQKEEGWDLLKIHPGLTLQEYDAMARTAAAEGIPFGGHVPAEVGIDHALESGQLTIDHLDGYIERLKGAEGEIPETDLIEISRKTRSRGAWVVPTMALWETVIGGVDLERMKSYPELKYLPRQMVDRWIEAYSERRPAGEQAEQVQWVVMNRKRLLKQMSDTGVGILFGTDAPQMFSVPGFSLHRETRIMLDAGLTPYQILRSATRNVGEYFSDKDAFGTVSVGNRADLVLLKANPLADIADLSRISGVMVRGRWLSRSDIDRKLTEIARRVSVVQ